ncbi:MAG: hypothetical protein R3313_05610, partial [Candidatus Saccharimonadales bacterium]|nr:hypothetical protein [Candidatus Saccharimonadales bacterium]
HGVGANLAVWFLKLIGMLRSEFRFTAYDLRGHGKSEMPATGYTGTYDSSDLEVPQFVLDQAELNKVEAHYQQLREAEANSQNPDIDDVF